MKLLNLNALFLSASLFFAADVAWASDASPEKLDLDSIEDTKSHRRGLLRGPAEERMAPGEPCAEGTARIIREVWPKIESIGMSTETVAENAGHVAIPSASGERINGWGRDHLLEKYGDSKGLDAPQSKEAPSALSSNRTGTREEATATDLTAHDAQQFVQHAHALGQSIQRE
ncbi:unnamed protein product [Hyaloperonospora brassicae]|uniref:RxLR effector candidate protein n=1 Tax=Hyaloperonospora brassicae TaxID=162125 RepID=A0AAV0UU86_HYABA|nr:unnamed protein product [Hyaloperonospora brassicae]